MWVVDSHERIRGSKQEMDTEHLIGATTTPYSKLTYQEAFERIARAG